MVKMILASSILISGAVYADTGPAAKEEPHSDPFRSCVSSECHAPIVQHKYLHGPLVIGQCTVCHLPLPGPDHKFGIQENDVELCGSCHKPVDTEKFLHDPVAEGKCLDCHDPHGSAEPSQVRISPESKLCYDCHDPVATKKYVHEPVSEGECLNCHRAHGGKDRKLLKSSGNVLCFECHEELSPVATVGRKIHLADEECAGCHVQHDSDYPGLLVEPPLKLCFGCHEDLKARMESEQFTHEAVTEDIACIACHKAHISRFAGLLKEKTGDLCFSCHDDLKAKIDNAEFKHQPVQDNACTSCHLPHSSRYSKRLFAANPDGSYTTYDPMKYALCFSCHDEALVGEQYTETLTDFRNGALNLHYLHVNRDINGRTCLTCHEGHAGSMPDLIRDESSFGTWKNRIRFFKTDNGGK
ncbi:MAG: cytochrome c3 family protein, partial [Acidobacteriota bacterium]